MTCCSHPFIHTMYKNDLGTVINKMANTTRPLVSTSTFIIFLHNPLLIVSINILPM